MLNSKWLINDGLYSNSNLPETNHRSDRADTGEKKPNKMRIIDQKTKIGYRDYL